MGNRYEVARTRVPAPLRERLSDAARTQSAAGPWSLPAEVIDGMIEGRPVRVLVGTTDGLLHVSVSRTDARRGKVGRSLPSWDDLVSVRACCWPDDVEVHQVLPALGGDEWVSVAEVLHLRGPLVNGGATA